MMEQYKYQPVGMLERKKQERANATREKILLTAMNVIRKQGYAATRIDDVCAEAGITKGAFFHHFPSKEAMAVACADHFGDFADQIFASAPYQKIDDPVQKLLGYIAFRKQILVGEVSDYTCLLGTLVQEIHMSHPALRDACMKNMWAHAGTVEEIAAAAIRSSGLTHLEAKSIAFHTQAVLQGAFILAKASQDASVASSCLDHLEAYIRFLFRTDEGSPTPA